METILKTPKDWARSLSFMGLQIIKNPFESTTLWNKQKISKADFEAFLKNNLEYRYDLGKGL